MRFAGGLSAWATLLARDWNSVNRYASALAAFTKSEPLPWSNFFIALARALVDFGRGRGDERTLRELRHLQAEARLLASSSARQKSTASCPWADLAAGMIAVTSLPGLRVVRVRGHHGRAALTSLVQARAVMAAWMDDYNIASSSFAADSNLARTASAVEFEVFNRIENGQMAETANWSGKPKPHP